MGKQRILELAVGLFMALGLGAMFFLAMQVSNLGTMLTGESYLITANFQNVGSLKVRASVKLAGVRIGQVEAIKLDQTSFEAIVSMRISKNYAKIPDDTSASILTAGLLGEQYISLEPGGSDNYLQNDGAIMHTQSALILEQLIGQFLFNKAGEANVSQPTDPANKQ
ncbi:ABC transporter substrate-binding protein [Achromatium sp. WMS2]|nr:ABC transporter substrate-binding protein [Achromatium sp. WMS2]